MCLIDLIWPKVICSLQLRKTKELSNYWFFEDGSNVDNLILLQGRSDLFSNYNGSKGFNLYEFVKDWFYKDTCGIYLYPYER